MKCWAAIFIWVVATGFCAAIPEEDKYTTKYDNVDVDEILHSERLLKNYISCLLDKGKCVPAALEVKKNLPDTLENGCQKCSPHQRETGQKVIKFLFENKRDDYRELEAKYDPNHIYRKRYEAEFDKLGVKN